MYRFFVIARANPPGNVEALCELRREERPEAGFKVLLADGVSALALAVNENTMTTEVEVTPTELDYLLSQGWEARSLVS